MLLACSAGSPARWSCSPTTAACCTRPCSATAARPRPGPATRQWTPPGSAAAPCRHSRCAAGLAPATGQRPLGRGHWAEARQRASPPPTHPQPTPPRQRPSASLASPAKPAPPAARAAPCWPCSSWPPGWPSADGRTSLLYPSAHTHTHTHTRPPPTPRPATPQDLVAALPSSTLQPKMAAPQPPARLGHSRRRELAARGDLDEVDRLLTEALGASGGCRGHGSCWPAPLEAGGRAAAGRASAAPGELQCSASNRVAGGHGTRGGPPPACSARCAPARPSQRVAPLPPRCYRAHSRPDEGLPSGCP
jgi:hypothetical protein